MFDICLTEKGDLDKILLTEAAGTMMSSTPKAILYRCREKPLMTIARIVSTENVVSTVNISTSRFSTRMRARSVAVRFSVNKGDNNSEATGKVDRTLFTLCKTEKEKEAHPSVK